MWLRRHRPLASADADCFRCAEVMGDNHLRLGVHRRLAVAALDGAVLVLMMRLSGSVKFCCAFGSRARGRGGGLPGFLRTSAARDLDRRCPRLRSGSAAALASASSSCLGCADLLGAPLLVATPVRHLLAAPLSRPNAAASLAPPSAATTIQHAASASRSSGRLSGGLDLRFGENNANGVLAAGRRPSDATASPSSASTQRHTLRRCHKLILGRATRHRTGSARKFTARYGAKMLVWSEHDGDVR